MAMIRTTTRRAGRIVARILATAFGCGPVGSSDVSDEDLRRELAIW